VKHRLLHIDHRLLLAFRRWHRHRGLVRLVRVVTHLGDTKTWFFWAFLMVATGARLGFALALQLGIGAFFGVLLSQPLKRIARRARPALAVEGYEALVAEPGAFSFPSGHTTVAVSIAIGLATAPFGIGPACLVAAPMIGVSRVFLGAHFPLDVAAGAVLGTAAGLASRAFNAVWLGALGIPQ